MFLQIRDDRRVRFAARVCHFLRNVTKKTVEFGLIEAAVSAEVQHPKFVTCRVCCARLTQTFATRLQVWHVAQQRVVLQLMRKNVQREHWPLLQWGQNSRFVVVQGKDCIVLHFMGESGT